MKLPKVEKAQLDMEEILTFHRKRQKRSSRLVAASLIGIALMFLAVTIVIYPLVVKLDEKRRKMGQDLVVGLDLTCKEPENKSAPGYRPGHKNRTTSGTTPGIQPGAKPATTPGAVPGIAQRPTLRFITKPPAEAPAKTPAKVLTTVPTEAPTESTTDGTTEDEYRAEYPIY